MKQTNPKGYFKLQHCGAKMWLDICLCPSLRYIVDITRWREDMDFMFEWQKQYLMSERSERVRCCSYHENIKFISSSQRVMFFLLYGETNSTKAKGGNRDVIERYDTHKGDTENTPLGSRMKWRMESTSGLVPSKTLSSI